MYEKVLDFWWVRGLSLEKMQGSEWFKVQLSGLDIIFLSWCLPTREANKSWPEKTCTTEAMRVHQGSEFNLWSSENLKFGFANFENEWFKVTKATLQRYPLGLG